MRMRTSGVGGTFNQFLTWGSSGMKSLLSLKVAIDRPSLVDQSSSVLLRGFRLAHYEAAIVHTLGWALEGAEGAATTFAAFGSKNTISLGSRMNNQSCSHFFGSGEKSQKEKPQFLEAFHSFQLQKQNQLWEPKEQLKLRPLLQLLLLGVACLTASQLTFLKLSLHR